MRKEILRRVGGFTEKGLPMPMEDFDLWIKIAKEGGSIGYQEKVLVNYRVHSSNISGDEIDMTRRDLDGIRYVKDNYELTDPQINAFRARERVLESSLAILIAKDNLLENRFREARDQFEIAYSLIRSPENFILKTLATIAPRLLATVTRRRMRKSIRMKISIVIPTYNREGSLRRALRSISVAERPRRASVEVFLVDNNSSDGTRQVFEEFPDDFTDSAFRILV